jgi:hypothetical protein
MLTMGNECIMLQDDQLMRHTDTIQIHFNRMQVKMHGQGSLVSDMTVHEDFLFVNFISFVIMWHFCGFILQVITDNKKMILATGKMKNFKNK